MALRRIKKAAKVLGWLVLGFVTLILLLTLGFYLGRGWIMNRAVTHINDNQPGELQMGQMNLIPFMNFPDVSLQLKALSYYEKETHPDSLYQEPILSLAEVYVTLDVVDLIRKEIQVSEVRMQNGFLRVEVYEDSISNLEKALGLRLADYLGRKDNSSEDSLDENSSKTQLVELNADQVELKDILFIFNDRPGDKQLRLRVNEVKSSLNYLPDQIDASIELNMDVNSVKYLTYKDETSRNIQFQSVISVDPIHHIIEVEPSGLKFSGLDLETWGTYEYADLPEIDFEFRARNEGLELLNYIFRGVFDLDEIEQIGSGSISLTGSIRGDFGDKLPVVNVQGKAEELGFRVKSIQKDVTAISFDLNATNGSKLDFSEGFLKLDSFMATVPEGFINANITASNLLLPKVKIELNGEMDIEGMEKMLHTEPLTELKGLVSFNGRMEGALNRETGRLQDSQGFLNTSFQEVGFTLNGDSLRRDSLKHLNGELYVKDSLISTGELRAEFNGNPLKLGLTIENLLPYFMDMDVDVSAELYATAEVLKVESLVRDTALSALLGDELKGLRFRTAFVISHQELDQLLQEKSVPQMEISVDSFEIELPVYADISNLSAAISLNADSVTLRYLNGVVGESEFEFSGLISNYRALLGQDSANELSVDFTVSSDLMRAEDFFTVNGEFLFPETYRSEYLEDFHVAGSVGLPVDGLIHDSLSLDFGLNIWDLGWNFRYYPLTFQNFVIGLEREGEQLHVNNFKGRVGESNFKLKANLENFGDSLVENLKGNLVLESDLLDLNELLNFQIPEFEGEAKSLTLSEELAGEGAEALPPENEQGREAPRLDQISYPQLSFTLDIGELRYGDFNFFNLNGQLRSSNEKVLYLDTLSLAGKSGGTMAIVGQFNVASPYLYTFSAELNMEHLNVDDLDIPMQLGDTVYRLKENFDGYVSADGLAEIFFTPDLKLDMSTTTAVFNVRIEDGALINFTPLQAAAKFLDNKDLNFVKFATLHNSFPLTLMDSRITVPLMNIESTVGQMLIEGEQGLDNSFLYLLRIPPNLAREAAKSVLSDAKGKGKEEEIQEMKRGNFYTLTVWSNGIESDFKLGDRRSKFTQ